MPVVVLRTDEVGTAFLVRALMPLWSSEVAISHALTGWNDGCPTSTPHHGEVNLCRRGGVLCEDPCSSAMSSL
jgi:hypothetical protein